MLLIVTPLYLLDKNIPIPIITLVIGIGESPWALKFLWGGIIDFYQKIGRKKFTIIGSIIGALGFLSLSIIDQYFSLIFFTLFLFIGHTGIGFLDAGADAWAIDISTKHNRGKINGCMFIGKSVSSAIGGPLLIIIGITYGYNIAFLITGLIIMVLTIIPLIVKYIDRNLENIKIWPLVKQEFKKKSTRLTTLYFFTIVLYPSLIFTLLVIIGKTVLFWEDTFIAIVGVISLIGGTIPGSIIGGFMADKFGRKKTLYIYIILLIIISPAPIIIFQFPISIILIWLVAINFVWSAITAANWAMVMDIINPKIGAAQHEIMCSIANAGDMGISAIAGTLFVLIGLNNIFILSALMVIPAIPLLYSIKSNDIN